MLRRRRGLLYAAVVGLAVIALAALLWPGDATRLQGTWAGDGVRLTFDGELAILEGHAYSQPRRTYVRLDPWASPKRIVVCDADAPDLRRPTRVLGVSFGGHSAARPASECRGIYELRGDRLRVCMPPPGADFPASFDPTAGIVLDLRRE
jgi:uncharacterized protein (TIGR03067 family)